MQVNKKAFKITAIIITIAILGWLLTVVGSFLLKVNALVEQEYGNLRFQPRVEKILEETYYWFDTSVMKNAPSCSAKMVQDLVSQIMKQNYLIDGESDVQWVIPDGENESTAIVGKYTYPSIFLSGITLEGADKNIKKNTCAATLSYTKELKESDVSLENQRVVQTDYNCSVVYTPVSCRTLW